MNRRMLTPVLSLLAAGATACAFPTDLQSSEAPDFLSLDRVERAVFADPDFRERFARSFAAETDIEPTLTSGEIKIMQELYEYLDEDRLDEGIEFLTEERNEASSPVFDYQLGNLYFRQDELEQAVASYE